LNTELELTIFNRKEEVEIMRLVGATNWYIRAPFLTESILYSILSTVITGIFLSPVFAKVIPVVTQYVNPQVGLYSGRILNYYWLLLALFGLALILSLGSTLFAIRKYLKI
jgi:cell division transport system permease protein